MLINFNVELIKDGINRIPYKLPDEPPNAPNDL
jgi:hypothetical protein